MIFMLAILLLVVPFNLGATDERKFNSDDTHNRTLIDQEYKKQVEEQQKEFLHAIRMYLFSVSTYNSLESEIIELDALLKNKPNDYEQQRKNVNDEFGGIIPPIEKMAHLYYTWCLQSQFVDKSEESCKKLSDMYYQLYAATYGMQQ